MQEFDINSVIEVINNIKNYPFVIAIVLIYQIIIRVFKRLNKDKEDVIPVTEAILNFFIKVQDTRIKLNGNNTALYKAKIEGREAKDSYNDYFTEQSPPIRLSSPPIISISPPSNLTYQFTQ